MSKPIGQAWPVELSNDVTLNMFRYYEDDMAYWLDIQGYRVPLTEKQYIALYEARIQVWDKATRYAEERIIKLLETHAEKELARLRSPSTYIVSEENYAYYEGILEAVSAIKGEQK